MSHIGAKTAEVTAAELLASDTQISRMREILEQFDRELVQIKDETDKLGIIAQQPLSVLTAKVKASLASVASKEFFELLVVNLQAIETSADTGDETIQRDSREKSSDPPAASVIRIAVVQGKAKCPECGRTLPLNLSKKRWHPHHHPEGALCEPDYDHIEFLIPDVQAPCPPMVNNADSPRSEISTLTPSAKPKDAVKPASSQPKGTGDRRKEATVVVTTMEKQESNPTRITVRYGKGKCPACGKLIPFSKKLGQLVEHLRTGGRACDLDYSSVEYIVLKTKKQRKAHANRNNESGKSQFVEQYVQKFRIKSPSASKNQNPTKADKARQQGRKHDHYLDRVTMLDPCREPRLQDFDIDFSDSSTSVRAIPGGLPSSNRRRH